MAPSGKERHRRGGLRVGNDAQLHGDDTARPLHVPLDVNLFRSALRPAIAVGLIANWCAYGCELGARGHGTKCGAGDQALECTWPVPLGPTNGLHVGSVHRPGSLRPRFAWSPVAFAEGASYELNYSVDPSFSDGVTVVTTAEPGYEPDDDLPVSTASPVGARYYWRVRACSSAGCTAYSPTWTIDVGRAAKDFNGDGYADLLIGAPISSITAVQTGTVYELLGGPGTTFDPSPDALLLGPSTGGWFGWDVAAAGDVNADGFTDAVIGANALIAPVNANVCGSCTDSGAAFVYYGGPDGLEPTAAATLLGEQPNDWFGWSVAAAGDVDADGYDDVLVGTHDGNRAYLFRGGAGEFDAVPDSVLAEAGGTGRAVAGAGDIDGDGRADVLVASPVGAVGGAVFVHFGRSAIPAEMTIDLELSAGDVGAQFGLFVGGGGDFNGDFLADVLVGAYDLENAGVAYLYMADGIGGLGRAPAAVLIGPHQGDLAFVVAQAGDTNGDLFDDLLVGAVWDDTVDLNAGAVYVFHGGSDLPSDGMPDAFLTGTAPGGTFGGAVAGAGDLNADGYADVVVGNGIEILSIETVYVYFGGPGVLDATPDAVLSTSEDDGFGISVD